MSQWLAHAPFTSESWVRILIISLVLCDSTKHCGSPPGKIQVWFLPVVTLDRQDDSYHTPKEDSLELIIQNDNSSNYNFAKLCKDTRALKRAKAMPIQADPINIVKK